MWSHGANPRWTRPSSIKHGPVRPNPAPMTCSIGAGIPVGTDWVCHAFESSLMAADAISDGSICTPAGRLLLSGDGLRGTNVQRTRSTPADPVNGVGSNPCASLYWGARQAALSFWPGSGPVHRTTRPAHCQYTSGGRAPLSRHGPHESGRSMLTLHPSGTRPLYEQITETLQREIADGNAPRRHATSLVAPTRPRSAGQPHHRRHRVRRARGGGGHRGARRIRHLRPAAVDTTPTRLAAAARPRPHSLGARPAALAARARASTVNVEREASPRPGAARPADARYDRVRLGRGRSSPDSHD